MQENVAGYLRFAHSCFIVVFFVAVMMGCVPRRLPEPESEKIHLAQALPSVLKKYRDVSSFHARLSLKIEVQGELHFARGMVIYERPERLRIRLTTPLGGAVGDIIFSEGFLCLFLPTKGKAYCGLIEEVDLEEYRELVLEMLYGEYMEAGQGRIPTRVYGEVERVNMRFELTLKGVQVNVPLPQGAFIPLTAGWTVLPLEQLWRYLRTRESARETCG